MSSQQLKQLPSVTEVLSALPQDQNLPRAYILQLVHVGLDRYRRLARQGTLAFTRQEIVEQISREVAKHTRPSLRNVINGTGIVLHTGLGRAPLPKEVLQAAAERLTGYVNLELELDSGTRGERLSHVEELLTALTGAERALVVNNNAAAVLIALNTLAENRGVIVSRGQLVEIGGSFRIPDIIGKSSCRMVEVGTTNRTHARDYQQALDSTTALILWVHTSNYVVRGFTHEVPLEELILIGKQRRIPVMADLGSGALNDLRDLRLPYEIQVSEVVRQGPDVVTFSGDKLLGGPQAGVIVGKRALLKRIQANPLYRALRCDKVTLLMLEEALRGYAAEGLPDRNLALTLLTTTRETLAVRGREILQALGAEAQQKLGVELVESVVQAGSGSLPVVDIPSMALRFKPEAMTLKTLAARLRTGEDPVVGFISGRCYYIDLKAVLPDQVERLIRALQRI